MSKFGTLEIINNQTQNLSIMLFPVLITDINDVWIVFEINCKNLFV